MYFCLIPIRDTIEKPIIIVVNIKLNNKITKTENNKIKYVQPRTKHNQLNRYDYIGSTDLGYPLGSTK